MFKCRISIYSMILNLLKELICKRSMHNLANFVVAVIISPIFGKNLLIYVILVRETLNVFGRHYSILGQHTYIHNRFGKAPH